MIYINLYNLHVKQTCTVLTVLYVYTGKWEKVTSFCRQPEYNVHGLEDGHKYNFRVRAENDMGVSDPLDTEHPIVAKYQFSKL